MHDRSEGVGPGRDLGVFAGRRVMVTGADGFMGSSLVKRLVDSGALVTVVVRRTSRSGIPGHLRNLAGVRDRLASVLQADLAEVDWLRAAADAEPEWFFHLAADAYVTASFASPREFLRANAVATLNVLEFCRFSPSMRRLVVVSSSEVYGPWDTAIDEGFLLQPTTPYAASKVAADRLTYSYRTSFGLPVVTCRPFNTYGPRHPYDVIPRFLRAALAGRELVVLGDGRQSRDFMYVDDVVEGLLAAAATDGVDGEVFNLGTGVSTSIRELAEMVVEVSGTSVAITHGPAREGEVAKLECNPSKAQTRLFWRAEVALAAGLERCWEWTLANRDYLLGAPDEL